MPAANTSGIPRVLHIVENLHHGAVENWLARMYRHGQQQGHALDWTFYCVLGDVGSLDEEMRDLGAKIVHSPRPIGEKINFVQALRAELRRGAYDVLHCHHDLISAIYLMASWDIPIRRRIVHVHNVDESVLTPNRWKQWLLREPMRRVCLEMADRIVGISQHTLDTFLHGRKRHPSRDRVHYYGVDATPFASLRADKDNFRRELNLPEDTLILLFAGRMVPEKNPLFTLDVLEALRRRDRRAVGVFAGAGPVEEELNEKARQKGLTDAIRLLGWRDDVARIMMCSDWFILPRPEQPKEGFGLAVVEAQLAGLRLLLSLGIADDPLLSGACVARLPLADGADRWADAAVELIGQTPVPCSEVQTLLSRSAFDMDFAFRDLISIFM